MEIGSERRLFPPSLFPFTLQESGADESGVLMNFFFPSSC